MSKEDIKKYLRMLSDELQKQEVKAQILAAEGVVMVLAVRKPKVRKDIAAYLAGDKSAIDIPKSVDAYFEGNSSVIREAALALARGEGLPDSWLDDALKEFFFTQPVQEKWLEYPGLRAYLAPTAYLLAMKVAAGGPQDIEDIKLLGEKLCVSNAQAILALITKYVPEELLTLEMRLRVEQACE